MDKKKKAEAEYEEHEEMTEEELAVIKKQKKEYEKKLHEEQIELIKKKQDRAAEQSEDNEPVVREEKPHKPKTISEAAKMIHAEERRAEIIEESKAAKERADAADRQRKAYEEKLRQERLELMKLKSGVISEEDIPKEEKVERTYTASEKVSNFFYHYKAHVILGALFIALAVFLIYDYVNTDRPDIQALYIAPDYDMSYYVKDLTELWSEYGDDVNGNGEKMVKMYYVPTGYADDSKASMYLAQSDRTKLLGEFQAGRTVMIIGNKTAYQSLGILEDVFSDCRELFPDDEYAEELGYRLAGTDFKELIGWEDMDDSQLYVSFRIPKKTMGDSEEKMRKNYDAAVSFWRNFIAEHRIEGAALEPTIDPEPLPDPYAEESETVSEIE